MNRLQRPMPRGLQLSQRLIGPGSSLIDPSLQNGDFLRCESFPFVGGGHDLAIETRNERDQPAVGALARSNHAAAVTPRKGPLLLIEPQATFGLFLAMTGE